jgi:signal transduction histidine kinase/GGDEF domain-containing protein
VSSSADDGRTGRAILGNWIFDRLTTDLRMGGADVLRLFVDPGILLRTREEERAGGATAGSAPMGDEAPLRVLLPAGPGGAGDQLAALLRAEGCVVRTPNGVVTADGSSAEDWDVAFVVAPPDAGRVMSPAVEGSGAPPARSFALLVERNEEERARAAFAGGVTDIVMTPPRAQDISRFVHGARERKRHEREQEALHEELARLERERQLAGEVTRAAAEAIDPRSLAGAVAEPLSRALAPDLIRCWIWGPDGAASWEIGTHSGRLSQPLRRLEQEILRVLAPGRERDEGRALRADGVELPGSWIAMPILARDALRVLLVIARHEPNRYTPRTARLLYRLAEELSRSVIRGEDRMDDERKLLEAVAAASSEGIAVTDARGNPVLLNAPARLMLNLPLEGEPAQILDQSEGGRMLFYHLSNVMGRSEATTTREFLVEGDTPRRVGVKAIAVRGAAGESRGVVALLDDVTSRREVDLMQSEFVTAISHELRTPLSCVKNYVDMVLDHRAGDVNETQERFLATARRNVDRLTGLIDNLLRLSRSANVSADAALDVVDLGGLASDALDELRAEADERDIELVSAIPPGELEVRGEADRLSEALKLVLREAIKLGSRGARLLVSGTRVDREVLEPPQERGPLPAHRRWVRLGVRMSPTGMEPGESRALFRRFRVHRESEGQPLVPSGLSLALACNLIEVHEGLIWAEPRGKSDLVFQIILPINGPSMRRGEIAERVTGLIERCRQNRVPVSLVVLRMRSPAEGAGEEARASDGQRAPDTVLHTVSARARECLRGEDRLLPDPLEGEVVLLLERSDKGGAAVAGRRLMERLRDLAGEVPDPLEGCLLEIGWATFPQEGITAQEILALARRRCTAVSAPAEIEP